MTLSLVSDPNLVCLVLMSPYSIGIEISPRIQPP